MPRALTLTPHLMTAELHARYRQRADPVLRRHGHPLWRRAALLTIPGRKNVPG